MSRHVDYAAYLQSDRWKIISDQAKKRAGYRCQLCNQGGVLHAHHRTYERLGNELDADVVCLCRECHEKFHNKKRDGATTHIEWLDQVKSEKPLFYKFAICQTIWCAKLSGHSVALIFGSDADDEILQSWNGLTICGYRVLVLKTGYPNGTLVASSHNEPRQGAPTRD